MADSREKRPLRKLPANNLPFLGGFGSTINTPIGGAKATDGGNPPDKREFVGLLTKTPGCFRKTSRAFLFFYMLQTHFQYGPDMVICQGVQNILPLPAELDQMHLLQQSQLMGNGTLGQLHRLGNFADAPLLLLQQG